MYILIVSISQMRKCRHGEFSNMLKFTERRQNPGPSDCKACVLNARVLSTDATLSDAFSLFCNHLYKCLSKIWVPLERDNIFTIFVTLSA